MVDNPTTKQILSDIGSTAASTYEDLRDIGDQVDYSKLTLEQLREEFRKFRKEYADFKWQVQKIIATEIQKQVQPLVQQLEEFTNTKKKVVYFKHKIVLLDFFKWLWQKLSNGTYWFFTSPFHRFSKSKNKR
jgi:chromosome segregation ATPase